MKRRIRNAFKKIIVCLTLVTVLAVGMALISCVVDNGDNGGGEEVLKTIYIDSVNGSDDNSGETLETAYKTLSKIENETIEAGTTVYLNGKFTYQNLIFQGSGTKEKPITITSVDEENPAHINAGGLPAAITLTNQSHITIKNLEISNQFGGYKTAEEYVASKDERMSARQGIFVIGTEGVSSGITIEDCNIHDIFATYKGSEEAQGGYNYSFYSSAAIRFRFDMPKCSPRNKFDQVSIKNNVIKDIVGCGIRFHDAGQAITEEYQNAYFSKVVIEDNLIDNTAGDGIILQNCLKPVVRRCKIFRVAQLEPESSKNFHCAVWGCAVESPLYEYNEVAYTKFVDGDGQAFDMDWGSKGTSIWQYNYTHDNEGGVILRHEDFKGIYRYNISVNDGSPKGGERHRGLIFHSQGGKQGATETTYFYNNVFYCDDKVDMAITQTFANFGTAKGEVSYSTSLNVLKNNIFVFDNASVDWGDLNEYEGNCYYRLGGASFTVPSKDSKAIKGNPSFVGAQGSSKTGKLNTYPASIDEAKTAFALTSNSPCKGRAVDLITKEKYLWEKKNFAGDALADSGNNVGAI